MPYRGHSGPLDTKEVQRCQRPLSIFVFSGETISSNKVIKGYPLTAGQCACRMDLGKTESSVVNFDSYKKDEIRGTCGMFTILDS